MDVTIQSFDKKDHVIEVGVDDTVTELRRNVASAVGLHENRFNMSLAGDVVGEGAEIAQLSTGDTIVLTKKTKKREATEALRALGETDLTAERVSSVQDPLVACLLLQAEVTTAIPDSFLHKHPHLSNASRQIRQINALRTTHPITALDLSALDYVASIGDNFLCTSNALVEVDLSGPSGVTHIGSHFLRSSWALKSVDLSGFTNVVSIGDFFMSACTALKCVDLSAFGSVTHIGNCFLGSLPSQTCGRFPHPKECCVSLTDVDLSELRNVTEVGDFFLARCLSLPMLDLSPLNLRTIGAGFLEECTALRALDLDGLRNVTEVGQGFLDMCSALTVIDLSAINCNADFGDRFLTNCTSLTSLDASALRGVACFGDFFLHHCVSLTTLDLSGVHQAVDDNPRNPPLYGCDALTTIHLGTEEDVQFSPIGFRRSGASLVRVSDEEVASETPEVVQTNSRSKCSTCVLQ